MIRATLSISTVFCFVFGFFFMRITVQNRTVSESHLSYSVLVNIGIIILFMLTAQLSSSRYKINKQ